MTQYRNHIPLILKITKRLNEWILMNENNLMNEWVNEIFNYFKEHKMTNRAVNTPASRTNNNQIIKKNDRIPMGVNAYLVYGFNL